MARPVPGNQIDTFVALQNAVCFVAFRWLLSGGLVTALYLYFETLGCVLNPTRFSFEGRRCDREVCEFGQDSCIPLTMSNGPMLVIACVYASYSLVFLSDARCTVKQILRGLAPPHLLAGFMLILLSYEETFE